MNEKTSFAEEVLIEVYKLLPLQGVLTDYEKAIYNIGDAVLIHRKTEFNLRYKINVGVVQVKPDIYLTIDKSVCVPAGHPVRDTARAIAEKIIRLSPPLWKAFAATCEVNQGTNLVRCLYGVKNKKKRRDKELQKSIIRHIEVGIVDQCNEITLKLRREDSNAEWRIFEITQRGVEISPECTITLGDANNGGVQDCLR